MMLITAQSIFTGTIVKGTTFPQGPRISSGLSYWPLLGHGPFFRTVFPVSSQKIESKEEKDRVKKTRKKY